MLVLPTPPRLPLPHLRWLQIPPTPTPRTELAQTSLHRFCGLAGRCPLDFDLPTALHPRAYPRARRSVRPHLCRISLGLSPRGETYGYQGAWSPNTYSSGKNVRKNSNVKAVVRWTTAQPQGQNPNTISPGTRHLRTNFCNKTPRKVLDCLVASTVYLVLPYFVLHATINITYYYCCLLWCKLPEVAIIAQRQKR